MYLELPIFIYLILTSVAKIYNNKWSNCEKLTPMLSRRIYATLKLFANCEDVSSGGDLWAEK